MKVAISVLISIPKTLVTAFVQFLIDSQSIFKESFLRKEKQLLLLRIRKDLQTTFLNTKKLFVHTDLLQHRSAISLIFKQQ